MLRLRPYKACDAETIVTWIKDEMTFYKWSAGRLGQYPITADDMNTYYQSFAYTDHYFKMTAFDEMGIAGHLMMRFLDEEKKELRFGFIIVDGEKRGKGYGKEMLKLAIGYAFETLKTERITIGVFENNESARRCYESVGFRATGRVEMYSILGEKWTCRELELGRE